MKAISGSELQRPQMSLTVECRFAYVSVCVHVNHSEEREKRERDVLKFAFGTNF